MKGAQYHTAESNTINVHVHFTVPLLKVHVVCCRVASGHKKSGKKMTALTNKMLLSED